MAPLHCRQFGLLHSFNSDVWTDPPSFQSMQCVYGGWQRSAAIFEDSSGYIARDMLGSGEVSEQIDQWAKQPSQVACVSEDLKC